MALAALLARAACAQDMSAADLIANYARLEFYCDRGTETIPQIKRFERCVRRDGHYRLAEYTDDGWRNFSNIWSDGQIQYSYSGYYVEGKQRTIHYGERPHAYEFPRPGSETVPLLILGKLINLSGDTASLASALKMYTPNRQLSDEEFIVFEHIEKLPGARGLVVTGRIHVSRKDGLVRRFASGTPTHSLRVVTVDHVNITRLPSPKELWYDAPLVARYSLGSHPFIFITGLASVSLALGFACWLALALARAPGFIEGLRPRLWKAHARLGMIVAACLFVLALIALGGGGHPPPMAYVGLGAILAALGMALIACVILSSYLAAAVARFIRRHVGGLPR